MTFDFKKEYKEFYMPKGKPEIVTVPARLTNRERYRGTPANTRRSRQVIIKKNILS